MALKKCKECNKDLGPKVVKCIHCGTDQRNWVNQHPLITALGGLILFVVVTNILIPGKSGTSNPITSDPVTAVVNTVVDDDSTTINKEEFDQIQAGMSYEQVVSITGCTGELLSESGTAGTEMHTVMYTWKGHGSLGANSNAMFQGGKLINKAQLGLE